MAAEFEKKPTQEPNITTPAETVGDQVRRILSETREGDFRNHMYDLGNPWSHHDIWNYPEERARGIDLSQSNQSQLSQGKETSK